MPKFTTKEDLDLIKNARDQDHFQRIIGKIVDRMPEPRAYLCEPEIPEDPRRLLWEEGFGVLIRDLRAQDISIVDPEFIRELATIYEDDHRAMTEARATDPMFFYLVTRLLIQQVYIPDDGDKSKNKRYASARKFAEKKNVEVHIWSPVLYR